MLWLRNNGSTLTSQLVDSIAVVTITYFYAPAAMSIKPGETISHALLILVLSNYVFKMISALVDTIPFYIGSHYLARYLHLDPDAEFKKREAEKVVDPVYSDT